MRGSYAQDPLLGPKVFALLDTVFPGLSRSAERARTLGASWESVSTPFIVVENGRVLSHVGLIELPLVLTGRRVKAGTVHAVATHADHRGKGLCRRVMEEALEHAAGRYETLVLTTEHPEYFEPFGFRRVREHAFTARCESKGRAGFRRLDTGSAADVRLLNRLLETREAVSEVAGVVGEKAVFCFNEGGRPLHYSEELDALICMEVVGNALALYDVVAPRVPCLADLLERLPPGIEAAEIYFSPDKLSVRAEAREQLLDHDGPSHLMVRGPFPPEGRPFTLPRSART